MAITPPASQSLLSVPIQSNNFIAVQSAKIIVSNSGSSGSQSLTFTDVPGTVRITAKITNSGTKGVYLASGSSSGLPVIAVASTTTPQPASGTAAVATCDYIAAGAILTQDFVQGTDTFAAICGGSDTSTLEVSVGYGQ